MRLSFFSWTDPSHSPPDSARVKALKTLPLGNSNKAGKGIRTLDIQLGKLTLYQLSYARVSTVSLSIQLSAFMHPCTNRALRQG